MSRGATLADVLGSSGDGGGGGGGGGGSMSALEQMQLFEKRLKTEARRVPEKNANNEHDKLVNSTYARSINGQMDWECSGE